MSFLGRFSDENIERIRRQDARRISVVIGNPPYNANQQNENDNNKNREYPRIDDRVRQTFVKRSTAQKTKVYDMYSRFYRWAFDRIGEEGVVAFVTNRSFLDSRTFDGFRRDVAERFGDLFVVDLGGDVRANPRLSGTKHNVFGIQTGVAIAFFVRGGRGGGIRYLRRPEDETARDKLAWLAGLDPARAGWERVEPGPRADWIGQVENDWDELIPVADKRTKAAKVKGQERAVFKLFSLGVVTARDEWVTDLSTDCLDRKIGDFATFFNFSHSDKQPWEGNDVQLKWTRALKGNWKAKRRLAAAPGPVIEHLYRPFFDCYLCFDPMLNEMQYQLQKVFPKGASAAGLLISGHPAAKSFQTYATDRPFSYDCLEKTTVLPRQRYTPTGERVDNVTDWALNRFTRRYGKRAGVTKDVIFHYVYAALHDPVWREAYAINLRREFPRIPFHDDFALWAGWGARLMALHARYEDVAPWPLERRDVPDARARAAGLDPKPRLKADRGAGTVEIDSETTLTGLPDEAWTFRLGNRSGLEWVLDQHREKKVRDPTVEAWLRDNPDCRYRLAPHKERVIDLIARVARVSVETMAIVEAMRDASVTGVSHQE